MRVTFRTGYFRVSSSIRMKFLQQSAVLAFLFPLFAFANAQTLPVDPALGIKTIPLYDGPPPVPAGQAAADDIPTLTVFSPQKGHETGGAVIIIPGGAYLGLASNLEGRQVADWFTSRGFMAFVLKYRLGEKNLYPIPLLDAQRAVRLVRFQAKDYGYSPDRIGMVGFSAGGHLAATAGTLSHAATGTSSDQLSDRPDFLVLGYPWLNAMQPQQGKEITYCSLLHSTTTAQCLNFAKQYTPALHVTISTPTTFIFSTTDDGVVPVSTCVEFYEAMSKAGAPVEMHLFRHGPHGTGLGRADASLDQWPVLLEQWLRDQGLLTKP